jgi:hypothetical protein
LRDKNPYEDARTASDPRFWEKFQQHYYATVIIKKPKITHKAQHVDWGHMARKDDPFLMRSLAIVIGKGSSILWVSDMIGTRR